MNRTYHRGRRTRRSIAAAGVAVLAAAYGFRRWRPSRVEIAGSSMRPTLEPGDRALAFAPRRIRRGDVVVLEHPARPGFELVKRVRAMAGETAPNGRTLGPGELWVEGDDPDGSTDSRSFGPVPRVQVAGRLRLVYWPPSRWGAVSATPSGVA